MKFGIHGCRHGHIGMFINEMLELGHEFLGIYEPEGEIAKIFAEKFNVKLFNTPDELYESNPQIVGTSAVNNEKIDIMELCRTKGVHLMSDKPVVTNQKGFKRLEKIIEENKIQIGMMLTERFNPPVYALKKMIDSNVLGEPVNFIFIKPHKLKKETRPQWHFSKEKNGGIAIDLLIHDIDLVRWFTSSEITDFKGYAARTNEYEDQSFFDIVNAVGKTKNNVTTTFYADWLVPEKHWTWGDSRIIFTGTSGRAEVRATGDLLIDKKPYGTLVSNEKEYGIYQNIEPENSLTQDFIKRIEKSEDVIISSRDILEASRSSIIASESLEYINCSKTTRKYKK